MRQEINLKRKGLPFLIFLALHKKRQEIFFLEIVLGEFKSNLLKMKKTIDREERVLVSGIVVY